MSVRLLTDFERVLDDLDLYVYANWENGELVEGPIEDRHTVSAKFMWPKDQMPDPAALEGLQEEGLLSDE